MTRKILIAEDDRDIVELLKLYLESGGYQVFTASNGVEALELLKKEKVDLAVIDIMMPRMNGYALIKEIREESNLPIIVLSAKDSESDKIVGLNLGADDYVTKPFSPLEILARIQANLRRFYKLGAEGGDTSEIRLGELRLDLQQMSLTKNEQTIALTPMEFKILAKLMSEPGRVFTKTQLYQSTSGYTFESDDNTIMVHISKLREKIEEDPKSPNYIKTVRGLGYKIEKG